MMFAKLHREMVKFEMVNRNGDEYANRICKLK